MQNTDLLIRTKLHLPFIRPNLVPRPQIQARIVMGLRYPLTLVIAPAGFGKTTLVASSAEHWGMPVAWLSLDKDDNQEGRFLTYLIAALQGADQRIGSQAAQQIAASQPVALNAVLTSLINDLDSSSAELALVLDDYHLISNPTLHEGVAFLLEHCPQTFHLVIVTRSDPPLPLARSRARGQTVELRASDLRFTELEAEQFLNTVMGLHLDAGSVAALEERTEGWIAGLQMAALSMRDREDVRGFIDGFSGTNRFILDYLLEEVLANLSLEIQYFLLDTSILERLTAPLCDSILAIEVGSKGENDDPLSDRQPFSHSPSASILEYLERANLFLVPLDDGRVWYRYHHLFADLLQTQLKKSRGEEGISQLHLKAADWHEQNGLILEAIQHASLASDDELVERLIAQHYMEMVNRGEMSQVRSWMGRLSKELIYRRPWLCLFEALNHSWFGQLEEANHLLNVAEEHIRADLAAPGVQSLVGYHAYVKSRVTAMQGDTRRAIEFCLTARKYIPADKLGLQNDVSITLGYEYFLYGDFTNASQALHEAIDSGYAARAINNPVAAYALLARMQVYQGRLHEARNLLQKAEQMIREAGGQYLGATGLVEVEFAALMCENNDLEAALSRMKRGLDCLPLWGKTDDLCLAYDTLARIKLAQGNRADAGGAIEQAAQLIQTCGVFSEARNRFESAQVRLWLVHGDWLSINRWESTLQERFSSHDPHLFEDELARITQARVYLVQNRLDDAINLLSSLEGPARSAGRQGRLIEIMALKALALHRAGNGTQAGLVLTKSLELAEPQGYLRIFLDEGQPMQVLLAQWLSHAAASSLRDYAAHLHSAFQAGPQPLHAGQEKNLPMADLVEPLSPRELEVLQLMSLGKTNQAIARKLVLAPGTIKAHAASIYRKLDVANRTEAVARARQIGILH